MQTSRGTAVWQPAHARAHARTDTRTRTRARRHAHAHTRAPTHARTPIHGCARMHPRTFFLAVLHCHRLYYAKKMFQACDYYCYYYYH